MHRTRKRSNLFPIFASKYGYVHLRKQNIGLSGIYISIYVHDKETEIKYLKEKHDREAIEIELLNQSVEYYKRLNALTVPILMKSRNSQGAMHLKKEEWDIIMQNTDACFNDFTLRLKNTYPQLTLEEVRFACLLKMELSLSLLSEVYHIAKGSISRKKCA